MSTSSENTILAFSHIPKTAGTTFNVLLRRYFGSHLMSARSRSDSNWSTYRYQDFMKDRRVYPRLRCFAGHCVKPFEDYREFNSRIKWFTFLRDPTSRFVSHYIHQQTSSHAVHKMDLNAWAAKFNRRNWMVRMMAGEEDVEAAKQIINEKMCFVGLTEKFEDSVQIFRATCGPPDLDIRDARPRMVMRKDSLKQQIWQSMEQYSETIEENNALDQQLYDYVLKEIWPAQEERFRETGHPPQTAARRFQSIHTQARFSLER